MSPERNQPPDAVPAPVKKSYSKPRLQVYGNLRDITSNIGTTSPKADPPPHSPFLKSRTK